MKKLFVILFITYFLSLFFTSCKTDFEINAEWKDIPVIYGLLDQTDTTHYIRINKAYLGEGNALLMARKFDSTNYQKDVLDVKLLEFLDDPNIIEPRKTYSLAWDLVDKEPGTFYDPEFPKQTVYKTNAVLSENYIYKLRITNLKTGKIISSQSNLVFPFTIYKPGVRDKFNFIGKQDISWNSAKNGRAYQLLIRFHFDEINKTTKEIIPKYIDWEFPKQTVTSLDGGQAIKFTFQADQLYFILKANLNVDLNLRRKPGKADFIFLVAGDDFNTYLDVNKPSNSVVQERPIFTNISNGIGIFSCRYTNIRSIELSNKSIDSLVLGRYTGKLGFYNPNIP